MDSISQFVLGAAVGVAVMGRRTSAWKAAAWGGVCGTLPDLDVFVDHGDAIRNMTFHRTESHALFYLSLLAPPIAWLASRIHHGVPGFKRWWLMVWLALVTHPLLDWMTVYGTQLALPFSDHPYAVGSIFVIDPLYTLPLAIGVAAAVLASRDRAGHGLRWNLAGLALSTAYLAWSAVAQQYVNAIAETSLRHQGVHAERVLVVPTAFNTVLWRVLVIEDETYAEGFYSLLDADRTVRFQRYPRGTALYRQSSDNWYVDRIAWFSHGFFSMRRQDGELLISDLRMGQEPTYTFTFTIPEVPPEPAQAGARAPAVPPAASNTVAAQPVSAAKPAQLAQQIDFRAGLGWLWRRMCGERIPYPG